jgi:hypothetical protein
LSLLQNVEFEKLDSEVFAFRIGFHLIENLQRSVIANKNQFGVIPITAPAN